MIDGKIFFHQSVKNDTRAYKNIQKITTGQGDGYTTGCLLNYTYYKSYYKMIATGLSNQQELDTDPIAMQWINFIVILNYGGNAAISFIIEEAKETSLDFSQGTVKVLQFYFALI